MRSSRGPRRFSTAAARSALMLSAAPSYLPRGEGWCWDDGSTCRGRRPRRRLPDLDQAAPVNQLSALQGHQQASGAQSTATPTGAAGVARGRAAGCASARKCSAEPTNHRSGSVSPRPCREPPAGRARAGRGRPGVASSSVGGANEHGGRRFHFWLAQVPATHLARQARSILATFRHGCECYRRRTKIEQYVTAVLYPRTSALSGSISQGSRRASEGRRETVVRHAARYRVGAG